MKHKVETALSQAEKAVDYYEQLFQKIETKRGTIGVVGLGYVGIPLMIAIARQQINALGFDVLPHRVNKLMEGQSYLKGFDDITIAGLRKEGHFSATADMARLSEPDVLIICVPTPLTRNHEPDLQYVVNTSRAIAEHMRPGQLIILESTTYPGTTRDVMEPILCESGLVPDEDFFIAYSPEREDPGNINFGTTSIPKVVGANGEKARKLAVAVYSSFVDKVVPVSSAQIAEAVKVTENIFRCVNIALVNELKIIYDRMGIDVWEVIDAAATKPFGFMPFYPGPGVGGHCIPIDPLYLTWKTNEFNINTHFIKLATSINQYMPRYVVENLAKAVDKVSSRGLNGSRILVVGVAYKKNVDDCRESPAIEIIGILKARGAKVDYYDPYVSSFDDHQTGPMSSIEWPGQKLAEYDAVLVLTEHDSVDWDYLVEHSRVIVDTRNATRHVTRHHNKIFKT